jgi:hypothetical protein
MRYWAIRFNNASRAALAAPRQCAPPAQCPTAHTVCMGRDLRHCLPARPLVLLQTAFMRMGPGPHPLQNVRDHRQWQASAYSIHTVALLCRWRLAPTATATPKAHQTCDWTNGLTACGGAYTRGGAEPMPCWTGDRMTTLVWGAGSPYALMVFSSCDSRHVPQPMQNMHTVVQ